MTEALKRRLDRGIRYLNENPETIVIVSGGEGKVRISRRQKRWQNIWKIVGLMQTESAWKKNRRQHMKNLKKSLAFIDDERRDKIGIVTNNFHIYRAVKLAKSIGYRKVYAITASSNLAVFPNYMVREFFAVLALFLRTAKAQDRRIDV